MNSAKATLHINPKVLLAIYLVMPLSLLFVAIDSIFLNSSIKQNLPLDPRVYVWFVLIFMVPHIVASFFSFADKEYFKHYANKLLRGAQIAAVLGLFIPAFTGATIIPIIIFATYTMIHVFMQQSGISKSLMRNAIPSHKYWQLIGISLAIAIYTYLLVPVEGFQETVTNSELIVVGVIISVLLYSMLAIPIVRSSRTKLGKVYFLSSHFIPLMGVFYITTGYPILALIVPRVIHDLTAFTFYITHDSNRYKEAPTNYIYRLTSRLKVPIFIANPAISILAAYMIVQFNSATVTVILTCVFFLHYYTESFMWKKDTLHRMHINYTSYK